MIIYSEKKWKNVLNTLLAAHANDKKEKWNVRPAYYIIFPDTVPNKKLTIIIVQPEKVVNIDDPLEFTFTLGYKLDNLFEESHNCVDKSYLSLISNEEPLQIDNLTLLADEKAFINMLI